MYRDKKIAVVVKAYNVEPLIGHVIETIPSFVDRIYVVDDGSSDSTSQRVESLGADPSLDGRLELIRHASNQGAGGAVLTGYKRAIAEGVDVVAVVDGDGQMNGNEMRLLVDPVAGGDCDYAKGNRLFTGEAWQIMPRYRYLGNALLSLLTKIASGYWNVADSQAGYTAASVEALKVLPLDRLYKGYGYPNHLLVMFNVNGFRVQDVPLQPVYDVGEKSGIRLWKFAPKLSWNLLTHFLWRIKEKYVIRDFHPLVFFYPLSLLLLLLGIGLSGRMLWVWVLTGSIPPINALAVVFTVSTGLQTLFFAMWFDMEYTRRTNSP